MYIIPPTLQVRAWTQYRSSCRWWE